MINFKDNKKTSLESYSIYPNPYILNKFGIFTANPLPQNHIKAILFDLDMTLVDSSSLEKSRSNRNWEDAYNNFHKTRLLFNPNDLLIYQDKLGIVTSSPRKYAEKLCQYHKIEIPILTAYHDTKNHKPSIEPILHACEKIGINPKDAIYVGDTFDDMFSILNAGGTGLHYVQTKNDIEKGIETFKDYYFEIKNHKNIYNFSKYYIFTGKLHKLFEDAFVNWEISTLY